MIQQSLEKGEERAMEIGFRSTEKSSVGLVLMLLVSNVLVLCWVLVARVRHLIYAFLLAEM